MRMGEHPLMPMSLAFMQYEDFDEIEELGSGGYGTVYTAKYKKYTTTDFITPSSFKVVPDRVVLKGFKNPGQLSEPLIDEVSMMNL